MANEVPPKVQGDIVFVDRRQPPLLSGTYLLTVEQTLLNKNPQRAGADTINERYVNTRRFVVRGERLSLDASEVRSVFPPPNSHGEFANVLPHVVFERRTLPWERSADDSESGASWLALLLFEEGEAPPSRAAQMGDLQRGDFYRSKDDAAAGKPKSASTLPADTASYGDGFRALKIPAFATEYGESWWDPCRVIDVPVAIFSAIAPSVEDLRWLAHARIASAEAKASGAAGTSTECSVIVGNRLPAPNTKCTVHLVSLEGLSTMLPAADTYTPAKIQLESGAAARNVRLLSLRSWSFTSVDAGETFSGYLERVSVGALQRPAASGDGSDAASRVANAFKLGYTAVNHLTRLGDTTVSWLRGPLLPFAAAPVIVPAPGSAGAAAPLSSADQAVRYEPETGMMDVSYAAAWQMGRLIALQNRGFAVGLYNWKRHNQVKTALTLERQVVVERLGTTLGVDHAALRREGAAALRAGAAHLLTQAVAERRVQSPGGQRARAGAERCLMPRRHHHERLVEAVAHAPTLAAIHADTEVPDELASWLRALALLNGVPLSSLLPDATMLPPESFRFFQLDLNWVNALLEGACSIGRSSSADLAHDAALAPKLYAAAAPPKVASGFLLRSAVVDGWPGVEVRAYDANLSPLPNVLRMDRVAPSVLLFLAEGSVHAVDVQEPSEGLHFGVDVSATGKELRYVTVPGTAPAGTQPGSVIAGAPSTTVGYRSGRAIQIAKLARDLRSNLEAAQGNQGRTFTAAEFALQLVEGVQLVRFMVA